MIDILVIGSGIIGSWIAYLASKKGMTVALCEKEATGGDGISGRNSGVLHSGIYYSKDSVKLKHCLRGYELSLSFFQTHRIPYVICGKLITLGKTNQENQKQKEEDLEKLFHNGKQNGLSNLEILKNPFEHYKGVLGNLAIHVPQTGVVDVPAYLKLLWQLCYENGVIFLNNRKFSYENEEYLLVGNNGSKESIEASFVVNAAGLYSDEVAKAFGLTDYEIRPNKGEYYRLKRSLPYQKLIYPLPSHTSTALGVHYTFNMANEAYAGPNSNWAESKTDYKIQTPRGLYYESLCNILDCYEEEDLQEGYVGLRPRLFYKGEPLKDFVILESPKKIIHLLGIESPGLTSAPAIAETVVQLLKF